ncbi:MAG: hypothetical protein KDK36_20250, partial [Leptospiraceae bacterium]|nr:hypothetical protein [Leptospiraceae bacterium]
TDSNPLAYNEYDKNGEFTKTFESENGTMKLTYLNYGSKLRINMTSGEKQDEFIVLRSEPGKIFKETDGKLQEVSIKTSNVGEKTILKMAVDGKLQSTKIVDTKEVNTLKAEYLHSL